MGIGDFTRGAWDHWRAELDVVRAHPVHAPSDPPYQRAGVVYFFALGTLSVLTLLALIAFGDGSVWAGGWTVPFVAVAIVTGLTEIHFVPERQTILNDLFYIVPFVFFPVPAAAMLILLVAIADPIVNPRPLVRAFARLSSIVPMHLCALAGALVGRELVPGDHWWSFAAVALIGLAGERLNDYVVFPVSLRLGIGPDFSWREYLAEVVVEDSRLVAFEGPLIAVAASAYPISPWLVVALALPYLAAWRLALLSPRVSELERADDLKRQFVAMASHELRTPLTSISGFASTLVHRWDETPDEARREFVGVIDEQAARLARMIDQLLTISRIEAGKLSTSVGIVELEPLLARAVHGVGSTPIEIDGASGVVVEADPGHLEQIVVNFLANAVKYGAEPIQVCVVDAPVEGHVEVRVVDHGPGVPAAFAPRMFEQFAQESAGDARSASGTGLGLSIVLALARAQGTPIGYEPIEPHGSCFSVTLRRAAPEAPAARAEPSSG